MEAEETQNFLPGSGAISPGNSFHKANFDLKSYNSALQWVFIDYSNSWKAGISWGMFLALNIGVPLVSHFLYSCENCDLGHQRPFDGIVQISLSLFAALSFICLSHYARKFGLRRFLFLDKLCDESEKVRKGYTHQLQRSLKLLSAFVLPCVLADGVYKIWWFSTVGSQIPYVYSILITKAIVCTMLICSWLYRVSVCFLVCLLFRLTCYLQILRLEDFAQVFERESDVAAILIEHLRIRRTLRIISHRFRFFIVSTLILVTASQFASLLVTLEPSTRTDFNTAGDLALCSVTLVMGLFICLRSAAKITHKAQAVTSLAAKWHACATIDSFDELDGETPRDQIATPRPECAIAPDWDNEEEDGDEGDLDNTNLVPIYAHTITYQKRQALVTYFEHNKAGITAYGFILDRTWLHTIFAIQLSLTLWILNKTIGIS
ncbi:uncharacterized protein LOC127247703 [Andrographis paniculata]|uniref:uncharacterized protein LOC127247703 n=1 Tax=Andrographis paniculata TaxID=175694 RepID=UPI0021E9AB34|nr:uncharacterized protein LOC127247703 [Andrographis paniculata]